MGGGESRSPRAAAGFEQFPPALQMALQALLSGTMGAANTPLGNLTNAIGGLDFGGLGRAAVDLESSANPSTLLTSLDTLLRPAIVDRPFDLGSAALREQAALTGNLNSSGAFNDLSQFRGDLERNLAGVLPQTALQFGDLQRRAAVDLASLLTGAGTLPSTHMIQGLSALSGAAGQLPLYQPRSGGGFWSSVLPLLGTAAGAFFGGPGGAALGNALGTWIGGGGGGGDYQPSEDPLGQSYP